MSSTGRVELENHRVITPYIASIVSPKMTTPVVPDAAAALWFRRYVGISYAHAHTCVLDILFSSNRNIHKSSCDLCFWASDPLIKRFCKIYQLKGLKPKNKVHTNFYECCGLTEKVYLIVVLTE